MANAWTQRRITSQAIMQLMRDINEMQAARNIKVVRYADWIAGSNALTSGAQRITVDGDGNYFVVYRGRIVKFDSSMRFLKSIGTPSGSDRWAIACNSSGNVYVVVNLGGFIYDNDLGSLGTFSLRDPGGVAITWHAQDIAIDTSGNLYVANLATNNSGEVQIYNSAGTLSSYFSSAGCLGIAVDSTPYIYVARAFSSSDQVDKYNTSGSSVLTIGTSGTDFGELNTPRAVCVDSAGNVIVADEGTGTTGDRVQIFNSSGTAIEEYLPEYPILGMCAIGQKHAMGCSNSNAPLSELWSQTQWFTYTHTDQTSLGTSDGGVSIPSLSGLGNILSPRMFTDIGRAIVGLARCYDDGGGTPLSAIDAITWSNYGVISGVTLPYRTRAQMGDGHIVAGTDGYDYWCLVPHTADADKKPITGANYADYFTPNGTTGLGKAYLVGYYYEGPGMYTSSGSQYSSIVVGDTDGNDYICDDDHLADSSTRPTSGANWSSNWRSLGTTGYGNAWTTRNYYSNRVYDIDFGPMFDAVEYLKTATPL